MSNRKSYCTTWLNRIFITDEQGYKMNRILMNIQDKQLQARVDSLNIDHNN